MNESTINIYQDLSIEGGRGQAISGPGISMDWPVIWSILKHFEAMMVVLHCDSPDQVETGRRKPSQIRGLPQKRPAFCNMEHGKVVTKSEQSWNWQVFALRMFISNSLHEFAKLEANQMDEHQTPPESCEASSTCRWCSEMLNPSELRGVSEMDLNHVSCTSCRIESS